MGKHVVDAPVLDGDGVGVEAVDGLDADEERTAAAGRHQLAREEPGLETACWKATK